jgi:hypothetical protein
MSSRFWPFPNALLLLSSCGPLSLDAGQFPDNLLSGLQWRDVGPMRGGRSYAVAGHASQPDTFYFGSVGGGVWKTQNAGRTWFPISMRAFPSDR